MVDQQKDHVAHGEIGLEDIVIASRDFIRGALRMWWMFLLLFVIIGGYLFYDAYTTPVTYQATFTYMRDEDETGGMSGMASILGQFGLGAGRSRFNLDRVLELAKSRRVVQSTIFETIELKGKSDFIGNHLISVYELDEIWKEKKPELDGYRFTSNDISEFTDLDLTALKKVFGFIVGSETRVGLISATYSEESTILSLYAITIDEMLSIKLITELFDNLAGYYVTKITETQQMTYDIVKSKADSIGGLLAQYEMEYAQFKDANQNLYSSIAGLKEQRLAREIQKMNIIHGEALKNVEIADFSLRNATPIIRELDKPIRPLEPIEESIVKALIIGFLISLLAGSVIVMGIKFSKRVKAISYQKIE